MGDPSSTSKELCAKTAPVAPTPRRCRRSDGPRSFMVHRIETGRDCALDVDNGTDSIKWVDNGMGSGWSPIGVTTNTESGGPHNIILACHTRSKWTNTVKLMENIYLPGKRAFLTGRTVIWIRLLPGEEPCQRDDAQWKRRFSAIFAHQHYSFSLHE